MIQISNIVTLTQYNIQIAELNNQEDSPNHEGGANRSQTFQQPMEKKKNVTGEIPKAHSDRDENEEGDKEDSEHPRLLKPSHFDEYSFNIPHIELKSNVVVSQKLYYMLNEALSDLGFRNIKSVDFWLSLIILLLAMWIRAYLHAFGSWLMLIMIGIPVTSFTPMM